MRDKRTNVIYGNCLVRSPDGSDMFRCIKKKANWYLNRDLAILISKTPLIIQLTFQPNGQGHKNDLYGLSKKENKCVVCGTYDLSVLTKHHIVPYEYRTHFPLEVKEHSSHDVVSICDKHHTEYEKIFAKKLKTNLAEIYDAPLGITKKDKELDVMYSYARAIIKHGEKMGEERIIEMKEYIQSFHEKIIDGDIILELAKTNNKKNYIKHSEIIYENIKHDIQSFVELWRNHFITSMIPKFMPVGWEIKRKV